MSITLSEMGNGLKALHDRLLAEKPDGVTHEEDNCPLCAMGSLETHGGQTTIDKPEGGSTDVSSYTEQELTAAIDAVKDARIKNKKQRAVTAAVDQSVADAISKIDDLVDELMDKLGLPDTDADAGPGDTASLQARIAELEGQLKQVTTADLQSKLDAAVLEAAAEKKAREELEASIEAEKTAAEEAKSLEARKEERLAKVKEVASFPEEYLTENADRFAAMSDEDFDKAVEDWKAIAAKVGDSDSDIPAVTAMTAAREGAGAGANKNGSALAEIMNLRREGADPRTLR